MRKLSFLEEVMENKKKTSYYTSEELMLLEKETTKSSSTKSKSNKSVVGNGTSTYISFKSTPNKERRIVKEEVVYTEDMNNFTPPKTKKFGKLAEKDKPIDKIFEGKIQ